MALLKIDIDVIFEIFSFKRFNEKVKFIEDILKIRFTEVIFFRSKGGNVHVKLTTNASLSDMEILALQAIMGSDYKRETYNLRRILRGQQNWNILFEHEKMEEKKEC